VTLKTAAGAGQLKNPPAGNTIQGRHLGRLQTRKNLQYKTFFVTFDEV
jgi:hypothetical protein